MSDTTAAGRYAQLETYRQPFLDRAYEAAELTIPSLMPREGHTGGAKLVTPRQGMGARGVNNLSSKLLLALLPPNAPFFRLMIDEHTAEEMTGSADMKTAVEKALSKIERSVMGEIEGKAMRVGVHEALKHLVVVGNCLLYISKEGGLRVFRLDRFVVRRDPSGNVLEIITKESISPEALPDDIRESLEDEEKSAEKAPGALERTIDMYTRVYLHEGKWHVYQEIKGRELAGSRGTYALGKSPWIPLRWTRIDGEDYGRSHCDEYLGDLKALEALSEAIIEGAAVASRVIPLVDPNGTTDEDDLAEAENFEFVSGRSDDVSFLQVAKFADFSVAQATAGEIAQRLAFAFMLNTAVQRGGERVTAEEIRYMAGELEDALGGVYSILTQEMQLPLVTRLIHVMTAANKLPKLPKDAVAPTITTGVEALGRGHDLTKLDLFISGLGQTIGPEALMSTLNVGDYIQRRANALGINADGLIKSAEEQQQAQQAAQLQQLIAQLGPNAINQLGGLAQKGMEQNGEPNS